MQHEARRGGVWGGLGVLPQKILYSRLSQINSGEFSTNIYQKRRFSNTILLMYLLYLEVIGRISRGGKYPPPNTPLNEIYISQSLLCLVKVIKSIEYLVVHDYVALLKLNGAVII